MGLYPVFYGILQVDIKHSFYDNLGYVVGSYVLFHHVLACRTSKEVPQAFRGKNYQGISLDNEKEI